MWKHALTAVASATVLLVGASVPAASSNAAGVAATTATGAAAHAAVARAVAARDTRADVALAASADEAAARLVEQRRAEAAARAAAEAEAQRVAAEKAAQEAAAAQAAAAEAAAQAAAAAEAAAQAAAAEKAAQKAAKAKTKPAGSTAATSSGTGTSAPPAPPSSGVAWRTTIVNSGGQDAVNACAGGLTRWFENVDGKPYYPIHRGCGGTPILALHLGDHVSIDGATWVVTDAREVHQGDSYSAAAGLNGQILLQTCYRDASRMRIVALSAA